MVSSQLGIYIFTHRVHTCTCATHKLCGMRKQVKLCVQMLHGMRQEVYTWNAATATHVQQRMNQRLWHTVFYQRPSSKAFPPNADMYRIVLYIIAANTLSETLFKPEDPQYSDAISWNICSAVSLTQAWVSSHSALHRHYTLCFASLTYCARCPSIDAQPSCPVECQSPAYNAVCFAPKYGMTLWKVTERQFQKFWGA